MRLIIVLSVFLCIGCKSENKKEVPPEITDQETTVEEKELYAEDHRNQFHFSPPVNWMNDPNGMVYFDGEYHLFYQYHPESNVWGPMHWGHAISTDLVHWEHLPIALYPDDLGYIFSGSAVIDWKNTSGFSKNGNPPMVAIFTHHDPKGEKSGSNNFQSQSIAYSLDKGRTWKKYEANPVIPNSQNIKDFRDPKVIWDKDRNQWLMVLAAGDHVKFYSSKNLKKWTYLSDFGRDLGAHGGLWECPDFFPMKVENSAVEKWVLLQSINPGTPNGGSGTQYFIGEFDGKEFTVDPDFAKYLRRGKGVWLDQGRDNYAGVTWSDIPEEDGRRLFMGWMSNWDYAQVVPTEKWRSAMTLPRQLILVGDNIGYRLRSRTIKELEELRTDDGIVLDNIIISDSINVDIDPSMLEINLNLDTENTKATACWIELSNDLGEKLDIYMNFGDQSIMIDRTKSGKTAFSDKFPSRISGLLGIEKLIREVTIYLDHSSSEVFVNRGLCTMTNVHFPTRPYNTLKLKSIGGITVMNVFSATKLKSIW